MDKYTATFGKSRSRIISVHAKSVKEADAEIERQLDRPGRQALLAQWQAGNRMMIVNEGLVTINAQTDLGLEEFPGYQELTNDEKLEHQNLLVAEHFGTLTDTERTRLCILEVKIGH